MKTAFILLLTAAARRRLGAGQWLPLHRRLNSTCQPIPQRVRNWGMGVRLRQGQALRLSLDLGRKGLSACSSWPS
ncbi:hypothetical protein BKA61DRAFT_736873 [Leptodontidium sp. MPI-SDFR-AT-0119]|nr:hypothetical protein BKA61DRAFT_736873 [Leptodontidium sp. MPI-SDFR-AT-0119]